MELLITGRQLEVTSPLREYVRGKFERLSRHFDHVLDVKVILGVDKRDQHAEATINLSGKTLHAEASALDVYAAIDGLVDKLDAQVKKHKERIQDRRGKIDDLGASA